MSWSKIDRLKINYIANFEARKNEPIASVKSPFQIEEERKQKAFELRQQKAENAKNNINEKGQYHL